MLRDRKAERVDSANGRLKALRGLFAFAVADKTIPLKRNRAKEVAYLKSKKKGGFHTWSTAEVAIILRGMARARKPDGNQWAVRLLNMAITEIECAGVKSAKQ